MRAVVLYDKGKAELREIPKPTIAKDDILIEVKAAGICGSDLTFYYGHKGPMGQCPVTMGHEFAGVIVEKGEDADDYWSVGDRVVSDNTGSACGRCYNCSQGHYVACSQRDILGITMDGGFAEYVKIPGDLLKMYKNCLWKIPDNLSFNEASLMDPAANAYNAVIQQAGFKSGEVAVVFGVGALGLFSIAQAYLGGASQVIAVGMSSDRKTREKLAIHYGASVFIASDEENDIASKIRECTGGKEIDLVVDAVGHPDITKTSIDICRNEGTVVRIGMNTDSYNDNFNMVTIKNIRFIGHMGYNQESWRNSLALAQCGRLDLNSIISYEIPLEEYHKGFEDTKNQIAAKVILIP